MHFDEQAKNWDNDPKKIERAEIFAKEIVDFIKPESNWTALEFGCGTGLLSYQLKDAFETITLADNSDGMINVLREKIEKGDLKNFKALLTDLLVDNLDIGKFDVVFTLMTLHHIHDLDKVSQKFNSLLKPNGYVCIADLVKEDGTFHTNHPGFDGHEGFDKDELISILAKYGFKVKHYNISFVIEKEIAGEMKKYPLFLMIAKKTI